MSRLDTKILWQTKLAEQSFTFSKFNFKLVALEPIQLPPYKGAALRGGFGNVFRDVCCTTKSLDCRNCLMSQTCPYAYVFETPKNDSINIEKSADNYPHPFVIEPPLQNKSIYQKGETLNFSLVLFGKGVTFLPYFIYTFDRLGKIGLGKGRGKFSLISVDSIEDFQSGESREIYDHQSQTMRGDFKVWSLQDQVLPAANNVINRLIIDFVTPTRIIVRKKPVRQLTIEIFLRTLLRRISWLGKIHCEGQWDLPYWEIIEFARDHVRIANQQTNWMELQRFSTRQKQKTPLSGLCGRVDISGEIAPLISLIKIGQYTHLGKKTTFGLGQYLICS